MKELVKITFGIFFAIFSLCLKRILKGACKVLHCSFERNTNCDQNSILGIITIL